MTPGRAVRGRRGSSCLLLHVLKGEAKNGKVVEAETPGNAEIIVRVSRKRQVEPHADARVIVK